MEHEYIRLVISDLHIGSLFSKEEEIHALLENIEFDELILAGDIIDFIKIPTFTHHTAQIIETLNKISKSKPIIYVVGNHDWVFHDFVGRTVCGIYFVKRYDFEYAGRRYRIEHGDQYETGLVHWRFTMNLISIFHDFLERRLNFNLVAWWVKVTQKKNQLKRIWDIIRHNNDDIDVFIMGHTHQPEALIWVDKHQRIRTYVNTGDWVQNKTYAIIKDGQVRLKSFNKNLI